MKARDILRSVRAHPIDRAAGDAPSLGRLARARGTGLPKGILRRKRRSESGRNHWVRSSARKVIGTWSVVLAALAMGILVGALWVSLRGGMTRTTAEVGREVVAAAAVEPRVVSRFESPSQQVALDRVKRAMRIREPGQVEEFFRLGTASSAEVVEFLRGREEVDGAITGYDWLSSMDANGLLIDGVVVNSMLGDKPRNRLALLTPDEAGRWKIDFDAFARTVEPSWSEFMAGNAGPGRVCVMVAKDSYYNGPFRDEAQWSCYGMASPDLDQFLLGYCRQGSPQAAAMERIVSNGNVRPGDKGLNRALLEILPGEGAESRQFEITRVLAEDWVMSAKPFDENFK